MWIIENSPENETNKNRVSQILKIFYESYPDLLVGAEMPQAAVGLVLQNSKWHRSLGVEYDWSP